jgi:LemA protein
MDRTTLYLVLVFGAVAAIGLWWAAAYNRFVRLRNRAEAMWAEIDVQLKRRHDLVPNLVAVVGGYATHERATLDEVTRARSLAMAAQTPVAQTQAENVLTASLGRLFAETESYPQLKADEGYETLQAELVEIEKSIAMARGAYNLTVQQFNNAVGTIPHNIVAWGSSIAELEYLGTAADERETPAVELPAAAAAPARQAS